LLSGFMNMAGQIGGAVTVSLTPLIAGAFGWGAGFDTAAAVALLGGIAWLFVDPHATLSPSLGQASPAANGAREERSRTSAPA
jgi:ACS family glucarate transporter-like MFS transporter